MLPSVCVHLLESWLKMVAIKQMMPTMDTWALSPIYIISCVYISWSGGHERAENLASGEIVAPNVIVRKCMKRKH